MDRFEEASEWGGGDEEANMGRVMYMTTTKVSAYQY